MCTTTSPACFVIFLWKRFLLQGRAWKRNIAQCQAIPHKTKRLLRPHNSLLFDIVSRVWMNADCGGRSLSRYIGLSIVPRQSEYRYVYFVRGVEPINVHRICNATAQAFNKNAYFSHQYPTDNAAIQVPPYKTITRSDRRRDLTSGAAVQVESGADDACRGRQRSRQPLGNVGGWLRLNAGKVRARHRWTARSAPRRWREQSRESETRQQCFFSLSRSSTRRFSQRRGAP